MLLRGCVPVLQLRLRQQLHQGHHGFPHIDDAPLLRVDVRCIHHQPLQAGKRQRPWDPVSGGCKEDDELWLPFSIRSIKRCGVPTAMPVLFFWRKETCSSTLKCLANCKLVRCLWLDHPAQAAHQFCHRISLLLKLSHRPENSQSCAVQNPTPNTCLTRSAARRPADATMSVCGAPLALGASPSFLTSSAYASRNSGRFSSVLGFSHEVVSLMSFADSQSVSFALPPPNGYHPGVLLPEMYRSDSSTELRSVPNRLVFWAMWSATSWLSMRSKDLFKPASTSRSSSSSRTGFLRFFLAPPSSAALRFFAVLSGGILVEMCGCRCGIRLFSLARRCC